jgi:intracellular sulfur oxidation DsrE/DsrF family protein
MKHSLQLAIYLCLALLLVSVSATATQSGYAKQKVVYHVNDDDPKLQMAALRNIQNHINAVGADNLELRVVMHGNGVALVLLPDALPQLPKFKHANATEQMQAQVDGLKNQGVAFKICENTLKGRKVNREEHLYNVDAEDIVPSGVAELAHLQAQGFTYIKP